MKRQLNTLGVAVVAGLTLTSAALAQFGNGGAPPPPGQGGPGGGGGFGGPGRGGGGGGMMGRFALGAVSAVDATAGTITVTNRFTNQPQTIKVGSDVKIYSQTDSTVASLAVGDPVEVMGNGTQLTIVAGQMPGPGGGMMGGGMGRMGGFGGPGGGPGGPGGAPGGTPSAAFSLMNGKIASLSPLTISAGDNVNLVLKSTTGAKVSRIAAIPLSSVKNGDNVMAMGQADTNGAFTATSVSVNMNQGGGFGGPGGGRFGGFGGGGFGQGGQGGFGGGQGQGRRRRNGGGNGQGGGFGGGQGNGQGGGQQGDNGQVQTQPAPTED